MQLTYVRDKQGGFLMMEVLIALFILLIGLIGLAGLQARAQQAENESYQRLQALMLLRDMADRINANRANAASYVTRHIDSAGLRQFACGRLRGPCQYRSGRPMPMERRTHRCGRDVGRHLQHEQRCELRRRDDPRPWLC